MTKEKAKKIRDIQRLLKRSTVPDELRKSKELELRTLKNEQSDRAKYIETSKNVKKYKLVKFVEHQKAVRRLRQARKNGEAVSERKTDLEYIESFPLNEKYISLYKECDGAVLERRQELWKLAATKVENRNDETKEEDSKEDNDDNDKNDKSESEEDAFLE